MKIVLRTLLDIMAVIGTYSVLRLIWIYFETKELGYIIETKVDSTICFFVSLVIVIVAENYSV